MKVRKNSVWVRFAGALLVGLTCGTVGAELLPAAYGPVEYLQGDGDAYIDLGTKLTKADAVRLEYMVTASANQMIFGSRTSSSSNNSFMLGINGSTSYLDFYNTSGGRVNYTVADANLNVKLLAECSSAVRRITNTETGTALAANTSAVTGNFTTPQNAYLFLASGGPYNSNKFTGRIYSFTVSTNSVARMELVPCVRRSDSVCGFYDWVGETFLTNACSGSFTAGPGILQFAVLPIADQTFTGAAIFPSVTVRGDASGTLVDLTLGTDYTLAYANNVAVGVATATVTGLGPYAGKEIVCSFNIVPPAEMSVKLTGDFTRQFVGARWPVVVPGLALTDTEDNPLDPSTYTVSVTNHQCTGLATVWAKVNSGPFAGIIAAKTLKLFIVPDAYDVTEYTDLKGGATVDTGYTITDTMRLGFKFRMNGGENYGGVLKDYKDNNALTTRIIYNNSARTEYLVFFRSKADGGGTKFSGVTAGINQDIEGYVQKGSAALNGVEATLTTKSGNANAYTFKILTNANVPCRLYYLTLEDGSGDLRAYVPCVRKSDGAVGFYDAATDTFVVPTGDGTTEAGPAVAKFGIEPIRDYLATEAPVSPTVRIYERTTRAALAANLFDIAVSDADAAGVATVTVRGKAGTVYDNQSASVTFCVRTPVYVNPACANPVEPFSTPETASTNLTLAITAAKTLAADAPVEVRVASGTYKETGFVLDVPVSVVGASGDPADVEIIDGVTGKRAFYLSHSYAGIRDLTISGQGYRTRNNNGGHVYMTAGTVERCVIVGGYAGWDISGGHGYGNGGNVYMTGGRLLRSVIGEGSWQNGSSGFEDSYGAGVYVKDGVVDSCLIRGNGSTSFARAYGGGICAAGEAVVANCTFVKNRVKSGLTGGGIYVSSPCVRVVNCLFYDNGGTADYEFGTANRSAFAYCASSVTNDACATWRILSEDDFAGYRAKDFHLAPTSPLMDAGTRSTDWYPTPAATHDPDGVVRVSGLGIDFGAYEFDQSKITAGGYPSTYAVLEASNVVFTATAVGGVNPDYRIEWDYGNGVGSTSQVGTVTYAYPNAGLFTLRVRASADGGTTWGEWTVLPTRIVVAPTVMYVDPNSTNPVYPYKTRATAATKIKTALMTLTNNVSAGLTCVDGVTIRLLAGTITENSLTLSSAVTVVGDTGNPADVILNDNTKGYRAFVLNHAGATLRDLTITGSGLRVQNGYGGHVNMSAGFIENCVIQNGQANGATSGGHGCGYGGNVYMTGGRLVRSKILNGVSIATSASEYSYGSGVYVKDGIVDSCLIRGNGNAGSYKAYGGGVYADGTAVVANCTVLDNKNNVTYGGAGIYVGGASVSVVNCVMLNNGDGSANQEFGPSNHGRFSHCASSVTNDACETWYIASEADFVDYAAGNYTLQFNSALVDAGTRDADWYPASAVTQDLDGLKRVSGAEIDLGCHEVDQSSISCNGSMDAYGALEGESITFRAYAIGTKAAVTFRWDCGNGVTNVTTEGVSTYAYPAAGLYTVRLSASADGGKTWTDWVPLTTKPVIAPETMYVDPNGTNPVYPYRTRATAAMSLRTALQALTNDVSVGKTYVHGATVRLCSGTYSENELALDSGVVVRGDTGDPADVVFNHDVSATRAFYLRHTGAVLRDVTIKGQGYRQRYGTAGHVWMSAGTVEHCVITEGYAGWTTSGGHGSGAGGNVYMTGGRLVRSVIAEGRCMSDSSGFEDSFGGGVYAQDAVVDSCLIRNNGNTTSARTYGGALYAKGSTVVANCTFVQNAIKSGLTGAGIYVGGSGVRVVNCLFYDNGGTADLEFGTLNRDRFFHCASSVTNDACATWHGLAEADFTGYKAKDYSLSLTSPLVDAGSTDAEWYPSEAVTNDLAGVDRVSGRAIDLGCYEVDQSKVTCGGAPEAHGLHEGSNVTFNATAFGGGGTYVYRWDFGNGTVRETDEASYVYAYPDAGHFTVRVSASDDNGSHWSAWSSDPVDVVVAPTMMYVDPNGTNPVYPYKTRATAATKIKTALMTLTNNVSAGLTCVDGVTIRLLAGTITENSLTLSSAVTVVGDTGSPADVILNDNTKGSRAFVLSHAGATLRDLTITGAGLRTIYAEGGHVRMTAGLIDHCVIQNGMAGEGETGGHGYGYGGNVYMTGGRLVRSQILSGIATKRSGGFEQSFGAGVYATGGVIENCLIRGNGYATGWCYGGGVYAAGTARVVGCTIVDNIGSSSYGGTGVGVGSTSAKVVGCVMFDNGGTVTDEIGTGNLGRFEYCASSVSNEDATAWQQIDASAFVNYVAYTNGTGNLKCLRPSKNLAPGAGSLFDTGCSAAAYAEVGGSSPVDLRGQPRVQSRRLDIGCLESLPLGMTLRLR